MKTIELTITEEDLKLATKEYAGTGMISCCCLVFQAAKRTGLNPVTCSMDRLTCGLIHERTVFNIDSEGVKVTTLEPNEWHKYVGHKLTLTES